MVIGFGLSRVLECPDHRQKFCSVMNISCLHQNHSLHFQNHQSQHSNVLALLYSVPFSLFFLFQLTICLLPARASEQGNVIGSVRIYIQNICVQKKIVIELNRNLIYLKFVATDFFLKIISLSAGENSGDLA